MAVERQVVGEQRAVALEQQPQAARGRPVERERRALPEDAVVDEDRAGVVLGRALEQLGARRRRR